MFLRVGRKVSQEAVDFIPHDENGYLLHIPAFEQLFSNHFEVLECGW